LEYKIFITELSIKEVKKNFFWTSDLYVVDIPKIIKDLGYSNLELTPESEFIVNYSICRKIESGIYNSKNKIILILYSKFSLASIENLNSFLADFGSEIKFEIEIIQKND